MSMLFLDIQRGLVTIKHADASRLADCYQLLFTHHLTLRLPISKQNIAD